VVCALLATQAALAGMWERVFAWLAVALLIDGVDGAMARLAHVQTRLPRFSGERLDLVVDYVTYVFVPTLALHQAGYLQGISGLVLAAAILLSSLFHFADTESKTEDHYFVGFPAIWNVVAFYIFALQPPAWLTSALVALLVFLTFVPLKWAHPLRTRTLLPVTLAVAAVWCVAALFTLWRGFPATHAVKVILLIAVFYAAGLTLARSLLR
jgi:phosphatidylcholine synthase